MRHWTSRYHLSLKKPCYLGPSFYRRPNSGPSRCKTSTKYHQSNKSKQYLLELWSAKWTSLKNIIFSETSTGGKANHAKQVKLLGNEIVLDARPGLFEPPHLDRHLPKLFQQKPLLGGSCLSFLLGDFPVLFSEGHIKIKAATPQSFSSKALWQADGNRIGLEEPPVGNIGGCLLVKSRKTLWIVSF